MIVLVIIISIFRWRFFQEISLSKIFNYILLGYVLVYFGWLYIQVTFKLSFSNDWMDVFFLLFFVFALNLLLSKWAKPQKVKNRFFVQVSILFVFLSFYLNLSYLSPILDNFNNGNKINNNSSHSITTRGFITGFMDQGFVIIVNNNIGCFEKAVKYTDGYLHDISDEITIFYTDKDLKVIHLRFKSNFHMKEKYSTLPLENI
jgi:hypothetical protein